MASFLNRNVVDALFVPQTAADNTVSAALVSNPDAIKRSNPFAPIMVANAAKQVAEATMKQPDRHIGRSPSTVRNPRAGGTGQAPGARTLLTSPWSGLTALARLRRLTICARC